MSPDPKTFVSVGEYIYAPALMGVAMLLWVPLMAVRALKGLRGAQATAVLQRGALRVGAAVALSVALLQPLASRGAPAFLVSAVAPLVPGGGAEGGADAAAVAWLVAAVAVEVGTVAVLLPLMTPRAGGDEVAGTGVVLTLVLGFSHAVLGLVLFPLCWAGMATFALLVPAAFASGPRSGPLRAAAVVLLVIASPATALLCATSGVLPGVLTAVRWLAAVGAAQASPLPFYVCVVAVPAHACLLWAALHGGAGTAEGDAEGKARGER